MTLLVENLDQKEGTREGESVDKKLRFREWKGKYSSGYYSSARFQYTIQYVLGPKPKSGRPAGPARSR